MNYRQDTRTKDQFKADIYQAHLVQKWCVDMFCKELNYRGFSVSYRDTGTDNSGGFVTRPTAEPDFFMVAGKGDKISEFSLELKTAPHHKFWTIKLDSINALIYYNSYCLIVSDINTRANKIEDLGINNAVWTIFSPETAARLLLHFPVKSYANIYGGKPAIQIPFIDMEKWFILDHFSNIRQKTGLTRRPE